MLWRAHKTRVFNNGLLARFLAPAQGVRTLFSALAPRNKPETHQFSRQLPRTVPASRLAVMGALASTRPPEPGLGDPRMCRLLASLETQKGGAERKEETAELLPLLVGYNLSFQRSAEPKTTETTWLHLNMFARCWTAHREGF